MFVVSILPLFLLGMDLLKCFICHLYPAYQPSPQHHPFNLPTHIPHTFLCGLIFAGFAGFANFGHNCENKSSLSRKSSKMGRQKDNIRLADTVRVGKSTPRSYPLFADITRKLGQSAKRIYCPGGQNPRPDHIRCDTGAFTRTNLCVFQ